MIHPGHVRIAPKNIKPVIALSDMRVSTYSRLHRASLLVVMALLCIATVAQPPARKKNTKTEEAKSTSASKAKASAYRDFPTAQAMPLDAAWRRDIYRTLDLTKDANAVLYYPTLPQGDRMNLFTFLFHALLRGQIKAYDYKLDGNEDFSEKNVVKARELMDRYEIYYESKDDRVKVNDADLPSDQVKVYFVKESEYYDQHTATFHTKVTAICPVLKRGDDFGGADSQYPMFWLKYDDVAPLLGKLMLMGSNLNNAAMMSADDYFTLGVYKGDIYKTTNLQDRILVNEAETDTEAVKKEQQRIEREIVDFQDHVWGRDSVAMAKAAADAALADSIAAAEGKTRKSSTRRSTPARRSAGSSVSSSKSSKKSSSKSTKSSAPKAKATKSSGNGLSVRRQRH